MPKFIEPYNPNWEKEFENIKGVIQKALNKIATDIDIQHIGSTSVPGLFAKPILDIDIIITEKKALSQITAALEHTGYISKGEQGIPGRFAFRQSSGLTPVTPNKRVWQSHHLYVCYADSVALKNHLCFRDILKNNASVREKYSGLKKLLANKPFITKEEYTKEKTGFIVSVLAAAGLDEKSVQEIKRLNT